MFSVATDNGSVVHVLNSLQADCCRLLIFQKSYFFGNIPSFKQFGFRSVLTECRLKCSACPGSEG